MVASRETEHPDGQRQKTDHESGCADTSPDHRQAGDVDADERQAANEVDGVDAGSRWKIRRRRGGQMPSPSWLPIDARPEGLRV